MGSNPGYLLFFFYFTNFHKAELLQLNHTQFICRINCTNKKVGNRKNSAHFYYISFKSGGLSFFEDKSKVKISQNFVTFSEYMNFNKISHANKWMRKKTLAVIQL